MVVTLLIALTVTPLSQTEAPLQAPKLRTPLKVTRMPQPEEAPAPRTELELSEGAGAELAGNWTAFSADAVLSAPLKDLPLFAAARLIVTAPAHMHDATGPQTWKLALAPQLGVRRALDLVTVDGWVALPTSLWFISQPSGGTTALGFGVRVGARVALDWAAFAPYLECAVDGQLVSPSLNVPRAAFIATVGVRWGTT
jgi:hypothetical protein